MGSFQLVPAFAGDVFENVAMSKLSTLTVVYAHVSVCCEMVLYTRFLCFIHLISLSVECFYFMCFYAFTVAVFWRTTFLPD